MNQFRRFVLTLNHHSEVTQNDYSIPQDVSEYAQNIFVEVRKQEAESGKVDTTVETFHRWLTMSRLLSVTEGSL